MALTKNQRNLLKRANNRLSAILDKAANTEPALSYAPAVQDALNALEGRTSFLADDLKAAKSFLRKKTSTVTGARVWAAEQKLQPMPPAKPSALTEEEKRDIDVANKRLEAMRKRGDEIPDRYKNIDRFRKDTAALAHEFVQNPKTVKKPRKAFKQLPANIGQRVKSLAEGYQSKLQGDAFYLAKANGEIEEDVTFKEFKRSATPPQFTGADLEIWAQQNSGRAYNDLSEYWGTIRGMNFR